MGLGVWLLIGSWRRPLMFYQPQPIGRGPLATALATISLRSVKIAA